MSNFNVLGYSNEEKDIIKLWEHVLNKDFRDITEEDLKYWLPSKQFKIPSRFMAFLNGFKSAKTGQATVIALFPIGNDTFMLKTMFNSIYGAEKKAQLEYIYSVHVVKTNQGFKFLSLPQVYYDNWNKKTVNGIFDLLKSGNTDEDFYKAVEKHFNVKKENFGAFIRKELENI